MGFTTETLKEVIRAANACLLIGEDVDLLYYMRLYGDENSELYKILEDILNQEV